MSATRTACWAIGLLGGVLLLSSGCPPPPVDPSLSPPIIYEPIYSCAEMIAYSGADHDAKIHVYVNGTEVKEIDSWLGWGRVSLDSPLAAGDVVTAAQEVGGRISEPTREPVTVVPVSTALSPGQRLEPVEVVPPLYECQRAVRVRKVLPGAEVILRNDAGDTWRGMTPYGVKRFGTPELATAQRYDAMQQICEDPPYTSDWSPQETVQPRPDALPEAIVHEPIVLGSDACRVDDLIPGSTVEITADDGSGPDRVGGGTALEVRTIFKIDPPFAAGSGYEATQALCDLVSTPPGQVFPTSEVPAPVVQAPICDGELYVTVCDTVVRSTVRVFVDGTQAAQGAGNGGCVELALGGATVFVTGQTVTAEQEVDGTLSPTSTSVVVRADAAPAYNPTYWNHPDYQSCNNCYNYGCDIRTDTFAQPGHASGVSHSLDCASVGAAAVADGLVSAVENQCTGCTHLVALVIASTVPGDPAYQPDYHWYRRDDTGRWSHKPGPTPATDLDASDNPISDPETADRRYVHGPDYILDYSTFCTYYCVNKDLVDIDGSRSCS